MARKGDNTEDRPYRMAYVLNFPDAGAVVPLQLLRQLAAQAPAKTTARVVTMPQPARSGLFQVEEFLQRHDIRFRAPVSHEGGRKFVLEECPWDASHRAPDSAVFEGSDGCLGFKCFHNHCQGRGWREFREFYEPADSNLQAMPQLEDPNAARWGETAEWWSRSDTPHFSRKYLEEQIRAIEKDKKWQWVDSYPYTREDGTPVLVKIRFRDRANDKTFRQFLITENGGWKLKRAVEARDLVYRWPSLAAASEIFLVNGEKAADRGARQLELPTTCYVEGEGEWHTGVNETFRGKRAVVILDNDDKGKAHGGLVARALAGVATEIRLVQLPGLPPRGDLWDWIEAGGTTEQLRQIVDALEPMQPPLAPVQASVVSVGDSSVSSNWRNELLLTEAGEPRALLANVITALRGSPEWDGVLWRDEFAVKTVARKPTPWGEVCEWGTREDGLATDWLQRQGIRVSREVAGQGIEIVAGDRTFHPVREYLNSLTWDGFGRLHSWLSTYFGVEQTSYSAAVASRWLISAVARVMQPGCKADYCLILEGPQGIKKSTGIRTLADPWFIDQLPDLGTKDSQIQLSAAWVIELAELETISRAEVSSIKAFISCQSDAFRPPYGTRSVKFPRQCVFVGSVNHSTYLRDETGGRRFWPVKCQAPVIDIAGLTEVRDQLWAEAVCLYRQGQPWWLDTPELSRQAEQEQSQRYEDDPWDELIVRWVANRESVSIAEVLTVCLDKRKDQWTQLDKNRVARCLRSRGWIRYKARDGEDREWRYQRP